MIRESNKYILLLISVVSLFIASCDNSVVYTESYPLKNKTWSLMDVKSFEAQIADTSALSDLFFTIRTGADYPFRNIFLFVSTHSPNGNTLTDTLEYFLADDKGNWYGKGFGDVHELKLPYKSNVYFPVAGEYRFKIQHGMRIEDLKGVYDIGLRIEKIKQ